MISIEDVIKIHELLIVRFGGRKGIRDKAALDAAIKRPFATFDGKELYPELPDKAAALLESILINHPFIDGNKRIGYVLMRLMFLENETDIIASQQEKYNMVIAVANGEIRFEAIKKWLRDHLKKNI